MAWRRTGDKPLYKPVMVVFTDAYVLLALDELTKGQMGGSENGGTQVSTLFALWMQLNPLGAELKKTNKCENIFAFHIIRRHCNAVSYWNSLRRKTRILKGTQS